MATVPCTSDSGDAAADHAVFVDTNLDTHLAVIVSDSDTVSDLKKRIQQEHSLCFPDVGEIKILALKVKRKGKFYHLSDSMLVKRAFRSVCDTWFLSANALAANEHGALAANEHGENYNTLIRVSGNLIEFQSIDANTSADVVDLLPDGPSKRSSNFEDTFLLQDDHNQIMNHQSVVSQSHSRGFPRGISENLQIGKVNNAGSSPTVLSPVPGNDAGRKDEGQRDFVNLSLSGNISNLPEPVKEKQKRQLEYAGGKLLGANRMALNSLKECSRREITFSGEGEKGINEEYPESILGIQDQISTGKALQSGPTAKRPHDTLTEGGENSLFENVNSDSDKVGTRLEVRRSRNNVEGENVDYHNDFISITSKLIGNPNVESLRITETVGKHVDGEANTTLASGSISAGQSFSEQYFASPDKRQELKKKNNVVSTKYYDAVNAGNGDMERQNVEPGLGLSSENLGSAQVDHHPDERGHPSLVVQQPADLGDVGLEHNNRTVIPGDEMVVHKRSSKKTNHLSKTHDQVRPEACGRGDNLRGLMRKEDPSYISEHPINLKDSEHDDRSGIVECEVGKLKIITNKLKKNKKRHDPVEAEATSDIKKFEDTPSMVPRPDKGDHLSNMTSKVGQALRSQQSSHLKNDGNSLNDIETKRPESEVSECKKSSKKKRKSKKIEDQHYEGPPPHIVSSAEVPAPVRGDGLTDGNTKEDPPSLSQQHNNLHEDEVSEYHNGFISLKAVIVEPRKNSKKRKGSKKTLDQVGLETASGMEHSGPPANNVSSLRVPRSARGDDMIDSSPKGKPPISQLPNNLLQNVDSKYDDQSATLETIAVEPKTKKRKKSRHTQDELGVETPALLEHSGRVRNEVPVATCADDLIDAVLGDDPPFSSQQPNDVRHGVSQLGNGSAPLEDSSLKPKRNTKDRKKSRRTQDQAGREASSITGKSGGITNDVSVSEVAESVRGSYMGDITWNSDLLSASHSPNNPLVATVLLNDNETGTPEREVGKPTKSFKLTKKTENIEDHAGEEMSLGTGHSGETIKDISQVLTSVSSDHLIDLATDELADNRIRNVLDSLQQIENEEPNAVDMKLSKKAKKQTSSIAVDSLTQISNDVSHKDHAVSAPNVDKVKSPSKSTRKSKKLNSSSINQFSRLNLEAEDGRDINNMPKHGMLVIGSSLIDEEIPLEVTFEKDGPDRNAEGLQKSESIKNQRRSNIVADGEVSNGNQTNSKDIKKVQVNKIKKVDQPSSQPGSASSPKLNENQNLGVQVHIEVPVSEAMGAQSNKLKFTFKDAQRLDSTVKSSYGKAETKRITSVTNFNRKSVGHKPKVTVRNSSQKNDFEVVNSSKPMRSLLGSALFKDSIEETSDDEDETNDSNTSTRTPSNNSSLHDLFASYSDSDTDADSKQTGQKDSGKSVTQARYVTPKGKSLVEIMKSSSRYKKAKLVAAESQPDDEDDEEFVPDSQPK